MCESHIQGIDKQLYDASLTHFTTLEHVFYKPIRAALLPTGLPAGDMIFDILGVVSVKWDARTGEVSTCP